VSVGIPLAWLPTNQPRYGKRTTATGMQLTIGMYRYEYNIFTSIDSILCRKLRGDHGPIRELPTQHLEISLTMYSFTGQPKVLDIPVDML
jgi:hypothetical protein